MAGKSKVLILVLCLYGCDSGNVSIDSASVDGHPDPDLVGWWKFDEGGGGVADDSSGLGNTATVRNGQWGVGQDGSALEMHGTLDPHARDDGIVIVPLSDSLKATADEITIMGWTYRTAEHNVAVVAHHYPALFFGFHGPQFKWQFQGDGSTRPFSVVVRKLGLESLGGAWVRDRPGISCYADPAHRAVLDQWVHVAATYDGWKARLYADGIEICSQWFWGAIRMPDSPFTISGYLDESNDIVDEMTGKLDDIRIYKRALDQEEIRAVYLQHAQ